MSILNPNLMTASQRLEEIAEILAIGILRMKERKKSEQSTGLESTSER